MPWLLLLLAGLFETVWAVMSKYSQGFTRLWPTIGTIVFNIISVALLIMAMRRLPLGSAYAIWTGIGAVGTVIYGIYAFGESSDWRRMLCIGLIIAGIVGLEMLTESH